MCANVLYITKFNKLNSRVNINVVLQNESLISGKKYMYHLNTRSTFSITEIF